MCEGIPSLTGDNSDAAWHVPTRPRRDCHAETVSGSLGSLTERLAEYETRAKQFGQIAMTEDSRKVSAKIVNLDQVRQARQRANELRELNDYEMELIGTLLDRRLFIRALETSGGLPYRRVPGPELSGGHRMHASSRLSCGGAREPSRRSAS